LDQHEYYLSHNYEGLINCADHGRWGFINREGSFVIPPQYSYCHPFFEGLAAVRLKEKEEFIFIDRQNNVVIEKPFEGADLRFSEGLCAVWRRKGGFGFIDRTGRLVITYTFYFAGHFAEGLVVVWESKSAGYGFVDRSGVKGIPARFTSLMPTLLKEVWPR